MSSRLSASMPDPFRRCGGLTQTASMLTEPTFWPREGHFQNPQLSHQYILQDSVAVNSDHSVAPRPRTAWDLGVWHWTGGLVRPVLTQKATRVLVQPLVILGLGSLLAGLPAHAIAHAYFTLFCTLQQLIVLVK